MALFVLPGSNPGLLVRGTIDLEHRPLVVRKNGDVSTVDSASSEFPLPGHPRAEMLYPTVVGNAVVSGSAAFAHAKSTGRHLGIFDNFRNADKYAIRLHNQQARFYGAQIQALRNKWVQAHRKAVRANG
jgi:hypothetical protein